MDLTNFILLAVERNMVSNKFGLDIFYTAFKEAASNNMPEANPDEDVAQNASVLINHNFFLAVTMLAKSLFAHEENPFEAMFAQMLVDKIVTHDRKSKLRTIVFLFSDWRQMPQNGRRDPGRII